MEVDPRLLGTNAPLDIDEMNRLRHARVLLVGLGNIGSFLATLLARQVAAMRLVDRDIVEGRNVENQFYGQQDIGRSKVEVTADRLARLAPRLDIERHPCHLEVLPWKEFADVDIVLGALDSLGARQFLSEKIYPLRIPYIDGAVGQPFDVRVQVLVPGEACLQCSWGPAQYKQLSTEYPCRADASPEAPPTGAPACAGAAAASLMVAQCARLFASEPPKSSYEINGDLRTGRMVHSRRHSNARCRYPHETPPQIVYLPRPFAQATVGDLLAEVGRVMDTAAVQLEFRRGILTANLFGEDRLAAPGQLHVAADFGLDEFGLTPRDRVVVRAEGRPQAVHICFHLATEAIS